jgi:hypothetical protein
MTTTQTKQTPTTNPTMLLLHPNCVRHMAYGFSNRQNVDKKYRKIHNKYRNLDKNTGNLDKNYRTWVKVQQHFSAKSARREICSTTHFVFKV